MKFARWTVALMLLAAIAWFAARESERGSVAAPTNVRASSEAANDATSLAPLSSEPATDERHVVAASAPRATANAAPDLVVVHVIERESTRPVANARVRVLEFKKQFASSEVRNDLARLEQVATEFGKAYTSDAEGSTSIARVGGESILLADKDELFGLVGFNKYRNEITVELARDESLSVQTVDARGRPIGGVSVSIRAFGPGSDSKSKHVRAVTSLDSGKATIAHARFVVEQGTTGPFAACAEIVSAEPVEFELDPKAWPTSVVVLRLPPLGSAMVRVLDVDGTSMTGEGFTRLIALHPNESNEQVLRRIDTEGLHLEFRNGEALFALVEVGTELFAEAFVNTPELVKRADGPRVSGERVRIELGGEQSIAVLHGRVLDADDQAIVSTWVHFDLQVELDGQAQFTRTGGLTLDANGDFQIKTKPSSGEPVTRRLSFRNRELQGSPKEASCELHVDGDLAGGVTELGDVRLQVKPLVIDGTVVDDEGKPVAGAEVQLLRPNALANRRGPWIESGVNGQFTAADGKFAFRADWNDSVVGVQLRADAIVAFDPASFPTGSHDVRVRVQSSGTIAGTVLLDVDASPDNFFVACIPDGASNSRAFSDALHALPEPHRASFSIRGVPPGAARVIFSGRGGSVLLAFDGVHVAGGKPSEDPRLKDVDLRGLSHLIHLAVRAPSGDLATNAVVRMRARDGSRDWLFVATDEGRAAFNVRALPIDLVIGARGCRTKRVDGASADLEVELDDGIAIELALDPDSRAALPSKAILAAHFDQGLLTSKDELVAIHEDLELDAAGRASVKLGEPGRYRPDIRIERVVDGRTEWLTLTCTPETIEVRDSTDVQKFDVTLSPEELAKAKAFLGG